MAVFIGPMGRRFFASPKMEWRPEILALGPGGMKGFLEIGALMYLTRAGILSRVNTIVGCSVGAMIGMLYIMGCRWEEILEEAMDASLIQNLGGLSFDNIRRASGLVSNDIIRTRLERLVHKKMVVLPNMLQLYNATGIEFCVVAYNLTKGETRYITHRSDPQVGVIDAVLMSCNMPLIFQRTYYRGDTMVDGALGNPYPVDVYDDGTHDILGMYIEVGSTGHGPEESFWWYINHLVMAPLVELRKRTIAGASDRCKHLRLESPLGDITGMTFTRDVKGGMVRAGWSAARTFAGSLGHPQLDDLEEPDKPEEPEVIPEGVVLSAEDLDSICAFFQGKPPEEIPPEIQRTLGTLLASKSCDTLTTKPCDALATKPYDALASKRD